MFLVSDVIKNRKRNCLNIQDVILNKPFIDDYNDDAVFVKCPKCEKITEQDYFNNNNKVCSSCNYHSKFNSTERIKLIFDIDTVEILDNNIISGDPLNFPGYEEKLKMLNSSLDINEGVVTGKGNINGNSTYFGIMDYRFFMGSMGSVVGERLTRMIEKATEDKLPIIIFTASGGARMQEGMLSLYQMAKVVNAIERHNKNGLLYITVLTDPTMGGVSASFASIGDIIIAEYNANIGFAGRRVIEKITKEALPDNFQTAEFLFENGLIDLLCHRNELKTTVSNLLELHTKRCIEKKKYNYSDEINGDNSFTSWERVKIARHAERPNYKDYIENMVDNFIEIHGDRNFADDKGIVGGIGYLNEIPITLICNAKGKNTTENIDRNFGMAKPEGYRKVQRLVKQAEKFNRPVICLIDTPGAYCGIDAEQRGQSEAIAKSIQIFSSLKVPIISTIIGEGGSGGALATGVADCVLMVENSIYSVISPEGCASILFKDSSKAKEASEYLNISSEKLLKLGVIDGVIKEPLGGAHMSCKDTVNNVKAVVTNKLIELLEKNTNDLINLRYEKFRKQGIYNEL